MGYKIINEEERYFVVDENSYGIQKMITPNLANREIRVNYLEAQECPLNKVCVSVEHSQVSSICRHIGAYPTANGKGVSDLTFAMIFCAKDGKNHELKSLNAEGMRQPVKIENIEFVHIPTTGQLEKSNAFLVLK